MAASSCIQPFFVTASAPVSMWHYIFPPFLLIFPPFSSHQIRDPRSKTSTCKEQEQNNHDVPCALYLSNRVLRCRCTTSSWIISIDSTKCTTDLSYRYSPPLPNELQTPPSEPADRPFYPAQTI
jgi:hypothetical protein